MSYEDAHSITIGQRVKQLHYELTGERLQDFEFPGAAAYEAMKLEIDQAQQAVTNLAGHQPS